MKDLQTILKQEPVYLNDWAEDGRIALISDFEGFYGDNEKLDEKLKEWEGINILFASYSNENYSGDAFVLFEKEGKLFEVNGGHCSCYGLEGQFDPEETTLESLEHRLVEGRLGTDDYSGNEFATELKNFLGI